MSGKFDASDYVDVAERIRMFSAKFPEGSLQSEVKIVEGGALAKAYAYRNPDDQRPGIGHAFEPIPGKTPFTRDSEVMNAETSAWGRAIVALGFETKKIVSADEVRNRTDSTRTEHGADGRVDEAAQPPSPSPAAPPASSQEAGSFKAPEGKRGGGGETDEERDKRQTKELWTTWRESGLADEYLRALVIEVTGQPSTKHIPADTFSLLMAQVRAYIADAKMAPF
jgi:hypothetical protein